MKLTLDALAALTCPPGRRDLIVFDEDLRGFGVRVTAGGRKLFIFQYFRAGQSHRIKLGELTPPHAKALAKARTRAEVLRGEVSRGGDPVAERRAQLAAEAAQRQAEAARQAADAFTVRVLVERWVSEGLADRSAAHRKDAKGGIARVFAAMLDRPAATITPAEAQRAVDVVAKRAPVMARRARDYARAAWNWAASRGLVGANPFGRIVIEARAVPRDRALSDPELGAAWRAASAMPYPFGPMFCLLMLTLQRRGEVAGMQWAELAPDLATWTIPAGRAKNRRAHVVQLAEPARAILAALAALPRRPGQPWVFTTSGTRPVSGFSRAATMLRAGMLAELVPAGPAGEPAEAPAHWQVHDFRRTGVTTLARLGVAPHVADRILNHVQAGKITGVAAVYQRHEFAAEREAALRLWAAHVLAVAAQPAPAAEAPQSGNVIRLASARKRLANRSGKG